VNRGKLAKNRGENSVDLGNELRVLGLNLVGEYDEWATRNTKSNQRKWLKRTSENRNKRRNGVGGRNK
jgi:hypothetical protein